MLAFHAAIFGVARIGQWNRTPLRRAVMMQAWSAACCKRCSSRAQREQEARDGVTAVG
jgi:hypothetical protein